MRRAIIVLVATAAVVVATLSYHTPPPVLNESRATSSSTLPPTTVASTTEPSTTVASTTEPSTTVSVTTVPPTTAPPTTAAPPVPKTVDGPAIATAVPGSAATYGVVQVEVTVAAGHITAVQAVKLPPDSDTYGAGTEATTTSISNFAAPTLEQEALSAQSPHIDTVSGATYTSEAFVSSLQSALTQVGL